MQRSECQTKAQQLHQDGQAAFCGGKKVEGKKFWGFFADEEAVSRFFITSVLNILQK